MKERQNKQNNFNRQLSTPINNRQINQNLFINNSFSNQPVNNYMNNNNTNQNNINNNMNNNNNINNNLNPNSINNNMNQNNMNYNMNPNSINYSMNPNSINNMNPNSINNNINMNYNNNNINMSNMSMPSSMNNNNNNPMNMNSINNNNMIMRSYSYNPNNNMNNNFNINNNTNNMNMSNVMNSNISNNMNNSNFNNNMNMNNQNINKGNNFMSNISLNNNNNNNMYNNNMNANNNMINYQNNNFNNINNPNQFPALVGLNNIGATCFMNATLQCMSQIGELSEYFLNQKNRNAIINNNIAQKNDNQLQLCPLYLELIEHLWNKNEPNRAYSPVNFIRTVEQMNPLFKLGQAGDSKDFIFFLLEQLHTELKKPCSNYKITDNSPLNQYDRKNTLNHFLDEFKKELSILTDLFFGIHETRTQCFNCRNAYGSRGQNTPICYNFQIFNFLIFPLDEIKKMKNRNNNNNQGNNVVTIYDCFKYNQEPVLFTGENKNFCNICNKLNDSSYTTLIYSSPNILILILNRGKNNIHKVNIDFREEIDITDYVTLKNPNERLKYTLTGVITHLGESGPDAHFVATCRSSVNNKWYRFNDSLVNMINNVYKDIITFGSPYILFYRKNK